MFVMRKIVKGFKISGKGGEMTLPLLAILKRETKRGVISLCREIWNCRWLVSTGMCCDCVCKGLESAGGFSFLPENYNSAGFYIKMGVTHNKFVQ